MSLPAIDSVLLLAHGGPEKLEDIPAFLSHIRGDHARRDQARRDRPLSDSFVAEVVERYRLIGGASPLRKTTESLAQKLRAAIALPVYVGMRHWHPFIKDTFREIDAAGHASVLCICLAPHYSTLSILAYQDAVLRAKMELGSAMQVTFVDQWGAHPEYIAFCADEIARCMEGNDTQVLLTAHSLPKRILDLHDPYVDQLNATRALISNRLRLEKEPLLVFQSASPSPDPWLSPNLDETLERLAAKSLKNIAISPIGFVAENVEILYDLDIVAKEKANSLGMSFARTRMLNDSDRMVAIMQNLVEQSQKETRDDHPAPIVERLLA